MVTKYPSEEEIRTRAYLLWGQDGRPDGRSIDYWLRAARELEDGIDVVSAPVSASDSGEEPTKDNNVSAPARLAGFGRPKSHQLKKRILQASRRQAGIAAR